MSAGLFFSGTDQIPLSKFRTHYGGVKTGIWTEFIQTGEGLINEMKKLQNL
jgi:hypothetical protein